MPCSDWSLLGLGLEPDPEAGLGVVLGHGELGGGRHEEGLLDAGVDGGELPVVHPDTDTQHRPQHSRLPPGDGIVPAGEAGVVPVQLVSVLQPVELIAATIELHPVLATVDI